jgi:hypothetical protein
MCPEELANESARVLAGSSRENEEVDKEMVEIDRLDTVQNLLKYQEEIRRWRDKKVSLKNIKVGDFVLKKEECRRSRQVPICLGRTIRGLKLFSRWGLSSQG